MRILFFNYEYPPLGGGAGNATKYILKEFDKDPDVIFDVVTSSTGKFETEKLTNNITIHKLDIGKNPENIHSQARIELIKYSWKALLYSWKLAKKNKYDLTHSFFTIPCGFISLLLKIFFKIPYVVSLRGADVPGYTERFKLLYVFVKPLIKIIWKNSKSVIANSDLLRDLALKTNPKQKISVIYNGINTQEFFPDDNQKSFDIFRILFVSRLCQRKGAIYLLKAVKKMTQKENFKMEVILVGEGEEREMLENFVKENKLTEIVFFRGAISHKALPKIYQNATVFVFPSLNEGMSNSLLEALASGLPVIVTDVGGTKELVKENENGFVVPLKNSTAISENLIKLAKNPEIQKIMSRNNRSIAEKMSWQSVAQDYKKIYQEI